MKIRLALTLIAALCASSAQAALINGGFELPVIAPNSFSIQDASTVPGWNTTAADNQMEIWSTGFRGVPAFEGNQFAELNANLVSTLFQDVTGIAAGSNVGYQFAHRGRDGVDTMRFVLTDLGSDNAFGTLDDSQLLSRVVSDGNTDWGFYTGSGIIALGNTVRFSFVSDSAAGGGSSVGNFLDGADFGIGVGRIPEPGTLALAGLAMVGLSLSRRKAAR